MVAVWMVSMAGERDSEILQLALPERLLPQDKQVTRTCFKLLTEDVLFFVACTQTLWAKRDFKLLNGAFVKSCVTSIKYLPESQ